MNTTSTEFARVYSTLDCEPFGAIEPLDFEDETSGLDRLPEHAREACKALGIPAYLHPDYDAFR